MSWFSIEKKVPLTAENLKNILLHKDKSSQRKMLVPIFEEHNRQIEALVGKEYAEGTLNRYETSLAYQRFFTMEI